jgi:23S rRNA (guanosine2251-2'-O)-methyltransferase
MRKLANSELNRLTAEAFQQAKKIPVIIVLDNVRSQHNVGAVFRTSDAFLIEAVYLCGITATPPNAQIHKSALGAENTVKWKYFKHTAEAVAELKEINYNIVAIEQAENSVPLSDCKFQKNLKLAIIFGNEVKGIDQKIVDSCDECIEIPQFGTKHSLNISVAAGIVIWEIFNKLR